MKLINALNKMANDELPDGTIIRAIKGSNWVEVKVSKIERYDTKTIIKIGNSTFNVLEGEEIYTPSIVTKELFENISYEVE